MDNESSILSGIRIVAFAQALIIVWLAVIVTPKLYPDPETITVHTPKDIIYLEGTEMWFDQDTAVYEFSDREEALLGLEETTAAHCETE